MIFNQFKYYLELKFEKTDMINNTGHSLEFDEFLDFIGDRIELKNFQKYI